MSQGDDHIFENLFLVCSRSAYNGELSNPNTSLLDVFDFVKNVLLSLGVTIEIKLCEEFAV